MQFIKRSEAIRQIYSGELFTMEFVTADEKRGTGGELIKVIDWQTTQTVAEKSKQAAPAVSKVPNHDDHGTVNICNPGNHHHPIKIHTSLIQTFNGKRILNG